MILAGDNSETKTLLALFEIIKKYRSGKCQS